MTTRVFEYHERTREQLEERIHPYGKRDKIFKQGFNIFTPKEGANKIRILPPTWEGSRHYGYDLWAHYNIGKNNSTFLCRSKMLGEKCPICEEVERSTDKKWTDEVKAKKKILVWTIDRNDEKAGALLFIMPPTIDTNLVLQSSNEIGDVLFIDHPIKGYDISFMRYGKGPTTKYAGETIARKQTPIFADPDESKKVLEYIQNNPLTEILVFKDYDYISKVFRGENIEEEVNEPQVEEDKPGEHVTPPPQAEPNRDAMEEELIDKFGVKFKDIKNMSDAEVKNTYEKFTNKPAEDDRAEKLRAFKDTLKDRTK